MFEYIKDQSTQADYELACAKFVEINKDLFFDEITHFKYPTGDVLYSSERYTTGYLRPIEQ